MYENNFWYLFDVKKFSSLNYDNHEGFLKPDIFFDLNGIYLFSDIKVL